MKIVATIEARMTSSRLPGKVLLPVCDRPMLSHLLDRLRLVPSLNDIVLATTTNPQDDILIDFAKTNDLAYFRGSEHNVLSRVLGAAKSVNADVIVEITADCPVIDPFIIEQVIQTYLHNQADYVNNVIVRSYPAGMDTQVFPYKVLEHSSSLTNDPDDLEHVSLYICNHPELYKHINLVAPADLHWPTLGLTLDEIHDYHLLKNIIEHFDGHPRVSCNEIIRLLRNNPDWVKINHHVKRKETAVCD